MPETFIHVWADVEGDWRPSSVYDATDHADERQGHSTLHAPSVTGMRDIFRQLKKKGVRVDRMDFHTHGSPGYLAIGPDFLGFRETKRVFHGHGFETIFKEKARIFFHGCNVAESAEGEMFLAVFGAVFLREGGGRVGASTSAGFAIPFSGKVLHPTGDTVYAHVRAGGSVSLENHRHLDRKGLRTRLEQTESRIEQLGRRSSSDKATLAGAAPHLAAAKSLLKPVEPSFIDLLDASKEIGEARKVIRHMQTAHEREMHRRLWKMSTQSMSSFK